MKPSWPEEHSSRLAELLLLRSAAVAVAILNCEFGTSYTRSAALGRAWRMSGKKLLHRAKRIPRETLRGMAKQKPKPAPRLVFVGRVEPPRPPVDFIKLRCAEITPLGISVLDLKSGQCRYPYGDADFTFCGHAVTEGSSYCQPHKMLCTRDSDHPRAGTKANPAWMNSVRKSNIPKAIALSSNDWEAA